MTRKIIYPRKRVVVLELKKSNMVKTRVTKSVVNNTKKGEIVNEKRTRWQY